MKIEHIRIIGHGLVAAGFLIIFAITGDLPALILSCTFVLLAELCSIHYSIKKQK